MKRKLPSESHKSLQKDGDNHANSGRGSRFTSCVICNQSIAIYSIDFHMETCGTNYSIATSKPKLQDTAGLSEALTNLHAPQTCVYRDEYDSRHYLNNDVLSESRNKKQKTIPSIDKLEEEDITSENAILSSETRTEFSEDKRELVQLYSLYDGGQSSQEEFEKESPYTSRSSLSHNFVSHDGNATIQTTTTSNGIEGDCELQKRTNDQRNVLSQAPLYASVFLQPSKVVHLVRHGQTASALGIFARNSFRGKGYFDIPLTPVGLQQAQALKPRLRSLKPQLVLVSPLTRALQTLRESQGHLQAPKTLVTALHSEHVATSGDVGRPPKVLAREFPEFSFEGIPEIWWFSCGEAPNDALKGIFGRSENAGYLRRRVGEFRQYLQSRPEQVILVVGHSTFFLELTGSSRRMRHCEILTIRV